ncbi:flagellar basal body rod protein FlgG [Piscibacillus halophilus]|uniref:Flagellar hook protein FlgE n=1 Tax=Piscibacillus halophilus TaxID=571933 RepID=A0A1H8YYR5_9BACI|nr:flagellar basal body rod protein FlgG [Piscibacillus halophilus]SEP57242.1 flagellar hook protein FlgE [Piscibacillus halophilus]
MLRSMYTGISGMKGFQTKLDVVSNNIANVNTFGYKKGRLTFSDLMSQTMQGATAPVNEGGGPVLGGRNPMQVGLGSSTGTIDNIHTQGNRQTTNRPLDIAIEGDGMFVLAEKSANGDTDEIQLDQDDISFTRAGNFYLDDDGYIVNANGQYLVGSIGEEGAETAGRIQIPENAQGFSIGGDGKVNYVDEDGVGHTAGQIQLAKFSNPEGLEKIGGNQYKLSGNEGVVIDGDEFNDLNDLYTPERDGVGGLFAGSLEMSNVDLSEEFTEMITSQRGFQANTRVITTSDEILQELVNLKR